MTPHHQLHRAIVTMLRGPVNHEREIDEAGHILDLSVANGTITQYEHDALCDAAMTMLPLCSCGRVMLRSGQCATCDRA